MTTANPLKLLLSHWDAKKVAKRFGVTPSTVGRWKSKGLPAARRKAVAATAKRVDQALQRAALNDDWAREQLSRWVEAGNLESETRAELRESRLRKRRSKAGELVREMLQAELEHDILERRKLAKVLSSRRFKNTPTGRSVGELTAEIERYAKAYHAAIDRDNPRDISTAWKAWERQVNRLLEEIGSLQIPGMSKRQIYTLFFSPI